MGRRLFVAGNWKMNKGPQAADRLALELKAALSEQTAVDVAVAPTALALPTVAARLKHTGIQVAAQNLHPAESGAFTGEIAGEMIRELGVTYVIIGHSERRHVFGETDEFINKKVHAAFRAGLLPILCLGETLVERDAGRVDEVLLRQLSSGLSGLQADQVAAVTLAYEPVWAIGTGRTASPDQAQDAHATIRQALRSTYPPFVAAQTRIQYGGSVKPANARELLSQPDVDGALVGGASLKADSFAGIIEAVASL